jgi:hypothetical protein
MFVRFRATRTRLQLSLITTRRVEGRVRHEHVASLGSVRAPATAIDRLEFWQQLHERLGRLNNRIDAETFGKVMTAVHERIPMVTQDEQRELKIQTAEEDARFAQSLHDMHEETVDGHRDIGVRSQAAIADGEAQMGDLAKVAERANQTAEKLRRGEDVPSKIKRPMTRKEFMAAIGWNEADVRHSNVLIELERSGLTKQAIQAVSIDQKHTRAVFRKLLRNHQRRSAGGD